LLRINEKENLHIVISCAFIRFHNESAVYCAFMQNGSNHKNLHLQNDEELQDALRVEKF
jgi:hypothetical protein